LDSKLDSSEYIKERGRKGEDYNKQTCGKQSNIHYSYTCTLTVGALVGDSLGLDDGETDSQSVALEES